MNVPCQHPELTWNILFSRGFCPHCGARIYACNKYERMIYAKESAAPTTPDAATMDRVASGETPRPDGRPLCGQLRQSSDAEDLTKLEYVQSELATAQEEISRLWRDHERINELKKLLEAKNLAYEGKAAEVASLVHQKSEERMRADQNSDRYGETMRVLRLILPLAKGYAAEHPVGSNAQYVKEAEELMARPINAPLRHD